MSAGLVGTIARLYVWDKWVPSHVIRAMARGVNAFDIGSSNIMPKSGGYEVFGEHVLKTKGCILSAVGELYCKIQNTINSENKHFNFFSRNFFGHF